MSFKEVNDRHRRRFYRLRSYHFYPGYKRFDPLALQLIFNHEERFDPKIFYVGGKSKWIFRNHKQFKIMLNLFNEDYFKTALKMIGR